VIKLANELNKERILMIDELRKQGKTYEEIGKIFGLTRVRICQLHKKIQKIVNPQSKFKYEHLVEEWRILRKQRLTYKQIGEKYNLSSEIINHNLNKYYPSEKINIRRKYERFVDEWKELKKQGLSYKEISLKYNCHYDTVYMYLTGKKEIINNTIKEGG